MINLKKDFKIFIKCICIENIIKSNICNFKITKEKNTYCVEHIYIPKELKFFDATFDIIFLFLKN